MIKEKDILIRVDSELKEKLLFPELVTELVGYYKNTQLVEKHCTYFRQETKDSVKLEWFKKFKK